MISFLKITFTGLLVFIIEVLIGLVAVLCVTFPLLLLEITGTVEYLYLYLIHFVLFLALMGKVFKEAVNESKD